jgi:capsular exopolysaccharide synthesis family protein
MVPKRRYASYLRERWWLVLLFVALCVGVVVTYETFRPESFTSFAQLHLAGDVQINTGTIFTEDAQNYYGTQVELLKSARLQSAAFEKAGITLKPGEKAPFKVDVYQPLKTSLLTVQVTGPDPALAQRFLKALVEEYLAYKKETRRSTSEDLVASLGTELSKREAELKSEQDKWVDFQKSNNVAVLEEEAKSAGMYLADLNLQLSKLKLEHELLEKGVRSAFSPPPTNAPSISASTNATGNTVGTGPLVSAANDAALKAARVELAVLLAEKTKKTNELSEFHPAIRKLNDDIQRLQKTVVALEDQDRAQTQLDLLELEKRMAATETAIPDVATRVLSMNERLSEGLRFKNNIQRLQGYYDHLLTTLQSVDLSKSVQQERVAVLQEATPGQPTNRYLPLRILLAAIAGLLLSLGAAFAWYLLDDRFVSVHDIQDQFGEMVLGLVPQIRVPRSKPRRVLVETADSRKAYAESYRHLRSALLLSSIGGSRPQSLLFTGAAPAEGKSTIAANLARVLARSGLRVVLVDMDPRGGGVRHLMDANSQPGVFDFLRGEAAPQAILHPTDVPGLSFLPAGSHTDHAEGLLLRPTLNDLMTQLRREHDFIILDSAPILSADDAALLVPHADAVVLVVRPFYSRAPMVRRTLDMLYQRQAKLVTIILNQARKDDLAGHYYNRVPQNGGTK